MPLKRLIPCLDVREGRTVKGTRFVGLRDAGDPAELAARYAAQGADELVFLDITAGLETRLAHLDWVRRVADALDIPFTVGGGVRRWEDAAALLDHGADKVAINSAAVADPGLLEAVAARYGRQCVVLAVDARPDAVGQRVVHVAGGRRPTGRRLVEWAIEAVGAGAGEILYTAIDRDGTATGYDLAGLAALREAVRVPLIASGGAGTPEHLAEGLGVADAVLAAGMFHFGRHALPDVRRFLHARGLPVRALPSNVLP